MTFHLKGTFDRLPHNLRDQFYPDLGNYRDQRLYPMDRTSVTVFNRSDHEVLTKGEREITREKTSGLTSNGEFGPISFGYMHACMKGKWIGGTGSMGSKNRWRSFILVARGSRSEDGLAVVAVPVQCGQPVFSWTVFSKMVVRKLGTYSIPWTSSPWTENWSCPGQRLDPASCLLGEWKIPRSFVEGRTCGAMELLGSTTEP